MKIKYPRHSPTMSILIPDGVSFGEIIFDEVLQKYMDKIKIIDEYVNGMPLKEIAYDHEVSENSIRWTIKRAIDRAITIGACIKIDEKNGECEELQIERLKK